MTHPDPIDVPPSDERCDECQQSGGTMVAHAPSCSLHPDAILRMSGRKVGGVEYHEKAPWPVAPEERHTACPDCGQRLRFVGAVGITVHDGALEGDQQTDRYDCAGGHTVLVWARAGGV